jgi:tetratricopeptide (TPR) repeat protein
MSSVRQIYLNTTLILVLLLIYAVLLVPLLGQNILWRANMQEESHRWDKAYLEYQQLIKLIPFSSKHVAEYGDFLVRLSASSTNPLVFLKPAVNIYKKAVLLNPLWAKAYLSLGLTELELGTREDKQYILSGINNIKKAIYYDPNGIDISYFAGDRVLSIWRFLSETEKEFVLDRLSKIYFS